jgi:hypothetical protein
MSYKLGRDKNIKDCCCSNSTCLDLNWPFKILPSSQDLFIKQESHVNIIHKYH